MSHAQNGACTAIPAPPVALRQRVALTALSLGAALVAVCGRADAGPEASTRSPYPLVVDLDKDGQPGGITNPSSGQMVEVPTFFGARLAALFFGDHAVSKLELAISGPPAPQVVVVNADAITDSLSGDIDCDGDDDFLAISFENVACSRQIAGGAFDAPATCAQIGGNPFGENCVKLDDLGGDACPEIIAVSNTLPPPPAANVGLLQVFPNNGAGVYGGPVTVEIPGELFNGCGTGDIDDDGAAEVAVIRGTSTVCVFRRTAPNTLAPVNASTGQTLGPGDPISLAAITFSPGLYEVDLEDVNLDGDDDLIVSNLNDIFIRPSNGNGTFGPIITLDGSSGTRDVCAIDLDIDGTCEVFSTNANDHTVNMWASDGPLHWGPRIDVPAGTSTSDVLFADADDDGFIDFAELNRGDGDAVWIFGRGFEDFHIPQRFTGFSISGVTDCTAGDFNADGYTDVLAATSFGDFALFLNLADGSGKLGQPIVDRVLARGCVLAALPPPSTFPAGSPDRIAAAIPGTNTVAVFEYDATRPPSDPFAVITTRNAGINVDSITVADINNDGVRDIAVTHASSTTAGRFYPVSTSGTLGTPISISLPTSGWDQFLAPRAGDGLPADRFFIADNQTGSVLPLTFTGSAFTAGTAITFGANCTDFALGKIDADGIADLVAARTGGVAGTIIVQGGLAAPTLPAQSTFNLLKNPLRIALGDINGDGKTDAVVSTVGPVNQNQYLISMPNDGAGFDTGRALLHPAGEKPQRPLLADLHLPAGTERGGLDTSNIGPEAIIGSADATSFQWTQSLLVLPNRIDFAPPPPPPACRADFNLDGVVSTPDLVFFLGRFGQIATPGSQAERADFNGNGTVDTPDLVFFLGRFGETCPR